MGLAVSFSAPLQAQQGTALPPIKVNLPPTPEFKVPPVPIQYPTGEMSVYGLRREMTKYLEKDIQVKAYLLQIYECPEEIRKCNEKADQKAKRDSRSGKKMESGLPPSKNSAQAAAEQADATGCRPCDQPYFFLADTMDTKVKRALLVADYPVKDWETGKPRPLPVEPGKQYVVTGTFSINSMTGFAASNGLIVHKLMEDDKGGMVAQGSAIVPPEATTINLEGKPPRPLVAPKEGAP
jgi:hypothetical protein